MANKGKVMPAPKPSDKKKKSTDGDEKPLPPWMQKKGDAAKKAPAKKAAKKKASS